MTDAGGGAASWGLAGGRIVKATVVAAPATTGTSEVVVVANPVSVAVITYDWRGVEEVRLASVVRDSHRIVRRADRDRDAGQGAARRILHDDVDPAEKDLARRPRDPAAQHQRQHERGALSDQLTIRRRLQPPS